MFGDYKPRRFSAAAIALAAFLVLSLAYVTLHAQMGGGMGGGMGSGSPGDMSHGMGPMMLVSGGKPYHSDGSLVRIDEAIILADQFIASLGLRGLALDKIEEWEFNFYAVVKETSSSQYKAFQLMIDKYTGTVMPGPGPNMMWNARYGRMMDQMADGMMGGRPKRKKNPDMSVTPEAAAAAANQFLRERFGPSRQLVVASPPDTFYGFYTFDVNDFVTGMRYAMLSVDGSSGQVWYHTWHGNYIQGKGL
ncbi:MAG: hypothetical protein AB1631_31010 [Acidobacteriota bacterium]